MNILNIYKSNNERRNKVAKIIKEKGIERDASKKYTLGSTSTYRSLLKSSQGALRSLSNSTGLTNYTSNRLKRLKANIQTLKKKKEQIKNDPNRIKEINKAINELKKRIKNTEGINYNETAENYENVVVKTTSKFDLDGEYNKLLLKKDLVKNGNKNTIVTYKNLLTVNKNNARNVNLDYKIFKKDNLLFNKFKMSVPYSEYNFLYGIDKHSKLAEERLVAMLFMTKIIFTFVLEPQFALITTVAVISLLLSRFALDYYRKYKRSLKKNIVFCTKYYPFGGIEHFSTELISKYHKIFYYDIDENENYNNNIRIEKNNHFYESIIELTDKEEKDFIEKNILFIKYLNEYENQLSGNIINKIGRSFNTDEKRKELEQIEQSLNDQATKQEISSSKLEEERKEKINTAIQESEKGTPISQEQILNVLSNNRDTNIEFNNEDTNIEFNNFNYMRESLNPKKFETKSITGGANLSVLVNNRNQINLLAKKKSVDKKITEQFSNINKAIFRLNYKINNEYILTSGDISIQYLFVELKPIINSRATFLEGELKPFSKSIPFFTNDYLTNLLDKIASESTKYGTIESTRIFIIDFIKEYIDNFIKLYQLAKYNILLLLKNPDASSNNQHLLLKELFSVNLSYTFKGRYSGFKNDQLKQIKYRDILNYYCVLLKYCQIALDHIHKRFKITMYNKV